MGCGHCFYLYHIFGLSNEYARPVGISVQGIALIDRQGVRCKRWVQGEPGCFEGWENLRNIIKLQRVDD
jgi:hypothetical protein